ncbi:MAG: hypothetical protein QOF89_530 [Acidobacteriota bacterium]|jgi:uncharacterized protein YukE|nr:hypothetical protein [Acidobacteriota bacterium]
MANPNQAYVDPEALRTLSAELSMLAGKIEQMESDLRAGLAQLGRTFRDDEYTKFQAHFLSSSQQLKGFVEAVRRLTPKLDHDAEELIAAQRIKLEL